MEHMFIVRRFAGAVSCTIGSFIDKNNDSIPADMSNRFSGSSNTLIPAFFQQDPTLAVQVREN
jgi:myosin-6